MNRLELDDKNFITSFNNKISEGPVKLFFRSIGSGNSMHLKITLSDNMISIDRFGAITKVTDISAMVAVINEHFVTGTLSGLKNRPNFVDAGLFKLLRRKSGKLDFFMA